MLILLLHTSAALGPAAHRCVHPCQLSTCTRQRACGASASGSAGGDTDKRLGEYWDKVTGFVDAFKVPSLKESDLPEATALSAQIELVAVKFSGVRTAPLQKNLAGRARYGTTPHTAYHPQVKNLRRPEDLKTTPSNEDFALLKTLAGAYIAACVRRVLEALTAVDRQPETVTADVEQSATLVAAEDSPPSPPG